MNLKYPLYAGYLFIALSMLFMFSPDKTVSTSDVFFAVGCLLFALDSVIRAIKDPHE